MAARRRWHGRSLSRRDTRLERDIAVKVLPPHLADDPYVPARFEREAKAIAALSHPKILAIFDVGSNRGVCLLGNGSLSHFSISPAPGSRENGEMVACHHFSPRVILRYNAGMDSPELRTNITTKVIRKGDPLPEDREWDNVTAAERIEAVWYLTLLCLSWNGGDTDEPRLQRSVVRIQRPRS